MRAFICLLALAALTGAMLLPVGVPGCISDKTMHFTAFLILGMLMVSYGGRRGLLLALICALAIECVQPLAGRTFEAGDIIANVSGVLTACAATTACR